MGKLSKTQGIGDFPSVENICRKEVKAVDLTDYLRILHMHGSRGDIRLAAWRVDDTDSGFAFPVFAMTGGATGKGDTVEKALQDLEEKLDDAISKRFRSE